MTKSSIKFILAVVIITMASPFVFGQGQAYSPLGLDLSGYWVQFGRQQDAGDWARRQATWWTLAECR